MKKLLSILLIVGFLAGGVFLGYATQPAAYQINPGDARWHTKLNAGLDALWGNITDFATLITDWVGTDSHVVLITATPTYSNGTTFTVPGDYTSRFTAGKVVQARLAATTVETTVVSSTYAAPNTTVVLTDSVLTNPITRIYVVATRDGLWPNGPGYVVAADYGTDQAALIAADVVAAAAGKQLVIGRTYSITSTPANPLTSNLKALPGGTISIANGVTLTINGSLDAGLYQIFSCTGTGKVVFGAGSAKEVYPQWWGTTAWATQILAAATSLTSGGTVRCVAGTYVVAPTTIILANAKTTLKLDEGAILDSTGGDTDYTIKVTGHYCSIVGPGAINVPVSVGCVAGGVANLKKAVIWNHLGTDLTVDGVVFNNIYSYGVYNEAGDRFTFQNNKVFGNMPAGVAVYPPTTPVISPTFNHFATYQDSGYDCSYLNNYVEKCYEGFGFASNVGAGGGRAHIHGNSFVSITTHPIYLIVHDYSTITANTAIFCGSGFATHGNYHSIVGNMISLNYLLWGTTQGGVTVRDSYGCVFTGNTISGVAPPATGVLAFQNVIAGQVAISNNVITGNTINMTSGTCSNAIIVGSDTVTILNSNNIISNNNISVALDTAGAALISLKSSLADTTIDCEVTNNVMESTSTADGAYIGIYAKFGSGLIISGNKFINKANFAGYTTWQFVYLNQSRDCELKDNYINSPVADAQLALYGFFEDGTNAQVYRNRYINNRVNTGVTGGSLVPFTIIAGNGSEIEGAKTSETYDPATAIVFTLAHGQTFFLTSAANRNFDPSGSFPVNYHVSVNNYSAGADIITFDNGGLSKQISANKVGMFWYNGTAWKGGVLP